MARRTRSANLTDYPRCVVAEFSLSALARAVTCLELRDDVREPKVAHPQQEQQVIEEVGRLVDHVALVLRGRRERKLDAFLADLLRHFQRALSREACRVAALGRLAQAPLDDRLQRP